MHLRLSETLDKIEQFQKEDDFASIKKCLEPFSLPSEPSAAELTQIVKTLYPLFLKDISKIDDNHDERSVYWKAEQLFLQVVVDRCASYKKEIKNSLNLNRKKGVSLKKILEKYTKKQAISDNADDILQQIFEHYSYPPRIKIPWSLKETYENLEQYLSFLEKSLKRDPFYHYELSWNIFQHGEEVIKETFKKWFKVIEGKMLIENNFEKNLELSINLNISSESNNLKEITEEEFRQWVSWLDHPSLLVRAHSAKCIGRTYADWLDEGEFQGHQYIPLLEMFDILYKKQMEGKIVLGGFINGCCTNDSLEELENHKLVTLEKFSIKTWVIKVAVNSPEREPYTPRVQAFWFYLHEYLDYDPDSINKLIDEKILVGHDMCHKVSGTGLF